MRRVALVAALVGATLTSAYAATTLQVVPTTTVAAETGNNTSASNRWSASVNGDLGPGNVSKVDTHTLLYPGFNGKIYAHLMGWFCMNAGSTATGAGTLCGSHIQVGYNSNDPAQVQAQVADMVSRGFDGVIHDWYGPGNSRDDLETRNYMNEAQQHPNFTFALMIDKGAIEWFSCYPGCTPTQALLQITQYAANTFFDSPAYMRINGRPVLTNFDIDLHYSVDWNYVAANTPGNPIFLFQNRGGFTHTLSSGSYSWVIIDSQYGLDYLTNFYKTGMQYPGGLTVGAMYKGFNDTLAGWSGNRIMSQQCGQTWLQTFATANSMYSSSGQLGAIQLVTWDDYEEGTELETGIDNCLSLSGRMSNTVLNWSIDGAESTIDHYTVFISTDGQNLMSLGDFPAGTRQVDLASYSPASGATYTLFVKAVGKPSLRNQMSGPVTFAYTPGVHMTPSNGAAVSSPVTVNAYAVSANPISAMVVYLDYNEVYRTHSGSVNTVLTMNAGSHLLVTNAWDSAGTLMQAKATINVVTQLPAASLTLSSTNAVAPATISASTAGSNDPNSGGSISSSSIAWGDGAISAGPTASHTYSKAGAYTVTATVTDNYGLSASTTQGLTINAPSVSITSPSNGATVVSPVRVTAQAVSGLPISAIVVYLDGTEVYRTSLATVDTNVTMTAGSHLLVTNAWDSAGTLMQAKITVTAASGPTTALSLNSTSGVAPVTVMASTSASTDANATISSASISWGDGSSSAGPTATHTYNTAGAYSVTATVTDSLGLSNTSAAQTVTVQPATVTITSPGNGATVRSPIQVSAGATSGLSIVSMIVFLDGNNVYSVAAATVNTAIATAPGAHTILVQATDSAGTTIQASVPMTISAQAITAALSVSTTSPVSVTASTAGSTDPNLGATLTSTIAWGDGTSSAGPRAAHTYANAGTFAITATVKDNYGMSSTASQQVTIVPGRPTPALSLSISGNLATASTAGSTDPNTGAMLTSVIAWGDGTSSSTSTAIHTYARPGNYTITATVADNYGMSACVSKPLTAAGVVIWLPAPAATVSSPVHISASAYDGNAIASMKVYVDGVGKYLVDANSLDTWIRMKPGIHHIVINAWEDVTGVLFQSAVTINVQ